MSNTDRIIYTFSALPINLINKDWVKDVWEADFIDLGEVPDETSSLIKNNRYNIKELEACCRLLNQEKDGKLWTILVENDISLKSTVVLLAYLLETGSKITASYVMKQASILAASIYTKLLAIPGSGAFKVFHPEILVKCVEDLKFFRKIGSSKRKVSSIGVGRKKSKHGKRKRKKTVEEDDDIEDEDNTDGGDDEDEDFSPSQSNRILTLLTNLLKNFVNLFEVFNLKKSESTAHRLISHFVQITRYEMTDIDFNSWPSTENMSVSCLAYKCLDLMWSTPSLNITILTAVCKCLLPNLLMVGKSVMKSDTVIVDQTIEFIRYIVKTGGQPTVPIVSTLIQHMCTKVLDKADFRITVAKAIVSILQVIPAQAYAKILEWLFQLSQHAKINHRTFALEVITLLLGQKEPQSLALGDVSDDSVLFTKHKSLMSVILSRCSDISPSVRTRAIIGFSHCFVSLNTDVISVMRDIVTPRTCAARQNLHPRLIPTPEVDSRHEARVSSGSCRGISDLVTPVPSGSDLTVETTGLSTTSQGTRMNTVPFTPFVGVNLTQGFDPDLTDNEGVISMLRRRSCDENAGVRRVAVQALQNIILFEKPNFRKENLTTLKERCCDPSLSVRKQSILSLTDILHRIPLNKDVQRTWLDGALPLAMDRENSLQDKCCELVEDVIFGNLTTFERSNDEGHQLLWGLLSTLSDYQNADLRRYLQLACQTLARSQKIKLSHMKSLETHIDTVNNKGAWLLIYVIAQFVSKINPQFVINYWDKHSKSLSENEEDTYERVLNVIYYTADKLNTTIRLQMIDDLKGRLKKFDSPPGLVATIVKTLSKLCECQATFDGNDSRSQKETWGVDLLKDCDEYLRKVIFEEKFEGDVDEEMIVCYLTTIGEVVQLCPANTPQRIYLLVQSFIAGKDLPNDHNSSHASSQNSSHASSQNSSQNYSQSSQGTAPIPSTQPFSQFRGFTSTSRVRTFAFTTLGKLLLQNERLAKKCIPAIARELETCTDVVLRNNIVIIMCDLCIRYTTVIDNYVPNIAVCLKDVAPLIRKQTLTLLTRLLQEDFIKWKGVLFYRFITTLLDQDPDIKDFAAFCMINILLQRQPNMFFNHFIECIFHFNGYTSSAVYNKFSQTEREKNLFNLKGDEAASKRLHLYLFMLEHTNDHQKFQLTSKLCQDLLGAVVDNILPLDADTLPLLKDALAILCSKEIKISSMKNKPANEEEDQDVAAVVLATAKKYLITQVVKKNVIENIVPIVTSLKYILEKEKSVLLKDLMMYLQVLMKDFKAEIQEILTCDKQLLKEIEFDIRRFEEEQTPSQQTPSQQTSEIRVIPCQNTVPQPTQQGNVTPAATTAKITSKSKKALPESVEMPRPDTTNGSLSATIFNSAKKNIERLQQLKDTRNSPALKEKRKSGVTWADENSKDTTITRDTSNSNAQEISSASSTNLAKTPCRTTRSRAISTPAGALGNITFAIDQNVSMIPPSPIPLGDGDDSDLRNLKQPDFDNDVIFLLSPERPFPRLKKWNIHAVKSEINTSVSN